jgi:hypothetical protein
MSWLTAMCTRRYKMAKHFTLTITEDTFTFTRNQEAITA